MLTNQIDYDKGLREYVERSFRTRMPALIDFSMNNQTVLKLLRHLQRHTPTYGSPSTAYQYVYGVWRYHLWVGSQPDRILAECWGPDGDPLPKMMNKHTELVDNFVGYCLEQKMAPGTAANHAKGVKQLYIRNGLALQVPKYPRTIMNPGAALTDEQLQKIMKVADIHEKVLVVLFAFSGFRAGTFCQLTYGDVKEDLERGVLPILIRVRPLITKGHGWGTPGYWTFSPEEGATLLKAYFTERRQGNRWFEPEEIKDHSPLVRNRVHARNVLPITPGAIWATIHALFVRAGIIKPCPNQRQHKSNTQCEKCEWPRRRRHELCVHSLRWYFRSKLSEVANPEQVRFMMGHKTPTYNDIQSRGPEFLRAKYASVDLCTSPKPKLNDRQIIEAFVRGRGLDPAKILRDEAEPHRIIAPQERDQWELKTLTSAVARDLIDEVSIRVPAVSSAHSNLPRATISLGPIYQLADTAEDHYRHHFYSCMTHARMTSIFPPQVGLYSSFDRRNLSRNLQIFDWLSADPNIRHCLRNRNCWGKEQSRSQGEDAGRATRLRTVDHKSILYSGLD